MANFIKWDKAVIKNKNYGPNAIEGSAKLGIEPKNLLEFYKLLKKNKKSLINLCTERKEAKLKYELETNTNLVSFSEGLIEISFNENLDKDFIKNLSNKLYEWTSKRWIISLSKNQGQISKKEKNKIDEKKIFDDVKKSETYKKVIEAFPDAELINVELKED